MPGTWVSRLLRLRGDPISTRTEAGGAMGAAAVPSSASARPRFRPLPAEARSSLLPARPLAPAFGLGDAALRAERLPWLLASPGELPAAALALGLGRSPGTPSTPNAALQAGQDSVLSPEPHQRASPRRLTRAPDGTAPAG